LKQKWDEKRRQSGIKAESKRRKSESKVQEECSIILMSDNYINDDLFILLIKGRKTKNKVSNITQDGVGVQNDISLILP